MMHKAAIAMLLATGLACWSDLVTDSLSLRWDAASPGSSPTTQWDPIADGSLDGTHPLNDVDQIDWDLQPVGNRPYLAGTDPSSYEGISDAYVFDGTTAEGQAISFQSLPGNPTDNDASWELWIKPDSLTGGEQILFETGGATDGMSFTLDDDLLRFRVKDGGSSATLTTTLTDVSDFVQVVGTFDLSNIAALYVNGSQVTTGSASGITNWANADASTLGGINSGVGGSIGGDLGSYGNFDGQISVFNFYEDVLSPSGVLGNYNTVVVPEPATVALLALGLGLVAAGNRRGKRRAA